MAAGVTGRRVRKEEQSPPLATCLAQHLEGFQGGCGVRGEKRAAGMEAAPAQQVCAQDRAMPQP